ncbi:NB-ARC domain-containing protein [Asticcacaulis sp. ZE23SCel15]|uniref:SIR2 family protein n=1 Tax=Asticcacaulis sp. ZE23SCel15 TaxID=3059027 RepID=UPI00265E13C4|nr:SIR2 family protein [Asticcacaulis sp. ZE23SCel15]WKL56749.1 NB-ARC domain-containing protein [Asticcacaulis sp. ZE23SCel15]
MTDFTTLSDETDYYDQAALIERLTNGISNSDRQIVFVVGSALTAPQHAGKKGIPGVAGIIDLISSDFADTQRDELARFIAGSENKYQDAFHFLLGRRGPQAANLVIRKAVALARLSADSTGSDYAIDAATSEDACRAFEVDANGWALTSGVEALGKLAVGFPNRFGKTILTTNFDPLISIAVSRAGGTSFRTTLHRDGNLALTNGDGAHIVHLHGYWYGADTLHTPKQLNQKRPQLRSSLANLLRNQIVVVLAYGGWDDAFTQALVEVVLDDSAYPEIIWCFRDAVPQIRTQLLEYLRPGLDRGRISFYGGIDCHDFLPALERGWANIETPMVPTRPLPLRPDPSEVDADTDAEEAPAIFLREKISASQKLVSLLIFEDDQPPVLDYYVGRSDDLKELEDGKYRVAYITGIGGQGKSALAASLMGSENTDRRYDHRVWRDCKEQSETFEDHVLYLIEALNDGRVSSAELSKQSIEVLADLFCNLTQDLRILIVFDNVDHYVDLELRALVGAAGAFVERFLANKSSATLVFTCRPALTYDDQDIFTKRLEGLDLDAARELFDLRGAKVSVALAEKAHETTGGHAFWLDLLAAQVAKRAPAVKLEDLLRNISSGSGEIPDATLRSIWLSLRDREQMVLQALAETLRPVSVLQLADYLRSKINFNQMSKAVRVLRDLNLVVVKKTDDDEERFELHPVIRAFIHKTFKRADRVWYIDTILSFYAAFFGTHRSELDKRPSYSTVKHWIEGAELCVNAGHFSQAFERLQEIRWAIRRSASPSEFIRVTQKLLNAINVDEWRKHQYFDLVFTELHRSLVNVGRLDDARSAIENYELTLDGKDARYINYCDMQTYMYWMSGDNLSAIKWGSDGADLKKNSGVDTEYSSDHNLALAQRDSGAVDLALQYFLHGSEVDEVLSPTTYDKDRGGAFYGNVGRCFQLMGQVDPALICYQKSAQIIDSGIYDNDQENQAYIRQWIGELLLIRGEVDAATSFLVASKEKWKSVSPPKACKVQKRIDETWSDGVLVTPTQAEAFVLRWICSFRWTNGA